MQTILGSGGAIGIPLAKELLKYTDKVRLVARHPKKVKESDELFAADLTNKEQVDKAVAGSDVVYLAAGLQYKINVWRKQWPLIMQNTIDACLAHHAKLVFVDNVYAYAPDEIPHMTEESRIAPETKKGKVRAELLQMIFDAIEKKGLTALIARSADFYGPNVKTGFLNLSVIDKFKKKQKAYWQADAHKIHSFTFTPDAAKAIALLGNTPDAYNQTWHLPTSSEKWTGDDFINHVAEAMHVKPRYFTLTKTMIALTGLFSPIVKELKEMQYQNDRDYFFDSSKFDKRFSFTPTSYKDGIEQIVKKEMAEL
ncbi:MAG: NAD-dependent epimerase/dehydratase family protein [Bacteroidota bacterium]|nr:NAD-dependent epimerase/dehydratase family protein [Bacteroidota bacterium]